MCGETMVIYADILIILNTLVNYFMLLAVNKINRIYKSRLRIFLGAVIGGISALLLFFEGLGIVMTVLKILTAVIMVAVTFDVKPFKLFIKNVFMLFAMCFLFGGLTFAVYIFFQKDILLYSNGIVYFDVDLTFLIICTAVSYAVITLVSRIVDKKAPKSKEYYVTVENGGKIISCTALMDTGNSLREPFSGWPVIIIDKALFTQLFNDHKYRLIPLMTVNGEALIKGFTPQKLTINNKEIKKVYIGESHMPLDEYKIILNINLEGEINNA